jgi:hypothetical protein
MITCRLCGAVFPTVIRVDGKKVNVSNRKYCLGCSPFRGGNVRVLEKTPVTAVCSRCGREYLYDKKRGHRKTLCNSCSANMKRTRNKERAVAYLGGSCILCGYSRCLRSLSFHHLDPETKDMEINVREFCRSWDAITRELDKCVLLCTNCHGEVHDGLVDLPFQIPEQLR